MLPSEGRSSERASERARRRKLATPMQDGFGNTKRMAGRPLPPGEKSEGEAAEKKAAARDAPTAHGSQPPGGSSAPGVATFDLDSLPAIGAAAAAVIRPPPNTKPGAMIGDKYRIERELGRGGFGVVVRAIHLTLDQRVAIKVLTEGEGSTEAEFAEDAARFRREAKATAALRSDHVVRVLDVDVLDSGYPYIVMEYLEGKTLHELVYTSPPLPIEDAVDYVIQVLAALAEAHSVGIVHRDLKPANVFLSRGPGASMVAKVLDFGVSKMIGATSQRLTRTGAIVGTVAYMSPEQMLDARSVDGRADLWSAGLVLYEALAKKHPFGTSTAGPKVVTAILNDPLIPVVTIRTDVPAGLDAIVTRLLDKSPERRFQTAAEVAKALTPFASVRSRPVLDEIRRAPPPSGAAAPQPPSSRGPRGPSAPSASATQPPSSKGGRPTKEAPKSQKTKKKSPVLLGVLLSFLLAAVALAGVAAYLFYFKPKFLSKKPPNAMTTPTASATASSPPPP